ncbi:hypothetical protein BH23VER1_BH23VER1_17520 [soil metagenome]
MELKPGYKQTEVGVIPEDWEVLNISEITKEISMGPFGSDIKVSNFVKKGVPVLSGKNVAKEKLHDEFHNFVTAKKAKSLKKAIAKRGDIVVTHRGTIGQIAYIPKNSEYETYVISQSQFRLRVDRRKSLPEWVVLYFHSDDGSRRLLEKKGHTGVPAISQATTTFRTLSLPLPTLAEQEAIAGALGDADALIDSLEQLIAKKRLLKQGAMQDLLTGKKRLPGFEGEWEETTLGEIAMFLSGGTPARSNQEFWAGEIPWISATSLRCFEIWRSDKNVTKEAVTSGSKMAPVGASLLLVRGSALHNEILCGLVTNPVCFNQDVKALVPHSRVVPIFLTILIRGRSDNLLNLVSSAGNTAGVLDTKLLKALEIRLPDPAEQTAIAAILSDMDLEIAALKANLSKARHVKQGMMQELLTGKTRLV